MQIMQALKKYLPGLGMEAISGTIILLTIVIVCAVFVNVNESFDNWQKDGRDRFTFDKCCTQEQIAYCEKFGKTGICRYNAETYGPSQCVCENAY